MRLLVLYSPLVSKGIEAMIKVCFVVNPFAGLGGPLALKGTDGSALAIAMKRARELVAPKRAERFVKSLLKLNLHDKLHILTAGKLMGSEILKAHVYDLKRNAVFLGGLVGVASSASIA